MTADEGLREVLRALKLSGMLDTLDARLAQARGGELGHLEFLQVLCQDEVARRDQAAFARRLRRAHFEEQVTLEGFDFTANPKLPAAQIRDLAALRWLHAGESVILTGPVGVGKTHVAQALGHPRMHASSAVAPPAVTQWSSRAGLKGARWHHRLFLGSFECDSTP